MMLIRPYLIYVAVAGEPLAESTSKWSKTKKKHRNVKLNAYKKKLIEKDGRKRRKMNSCDNNALLNKRLGTKKLKTKLIKNSSLSSVRDGQKK